MLMAKVQRSKKPNYFQIRKGSIKAVNDEKLSVKEVPEMHS